MEGRQSGGEGGEGIGARQAGGPGLSARKPTCEKTHAARQPLARRKVQGNKDTNQLFHFQFVSLSQAVSSRPATEVDCVRRSAAAEAAAKAKHLAIVRLLHTSCRSLLLGLPACEV